MQIGIIVHVNSIHSRLSMYKSDSIDFTFFFFKYCSDDDNVEDNDDYVTVMISTDALTCFKRLLQKQNRTNSINNK